MNRSRRLVLATALALPLAGTVALAEDLDVNALFEAAKTAYAQKEYGKSIAALKDLAAEIGRLRITQLQAAMPDAPEGWTLQDTGGGDSSAALALFGGAVTVQREYTKGDETRVTIQLLADNPMVAGVVTLFQNPQFLPAGSKVVTIKGRKAVQEVHAEDRRASLRLILNANTALVTVEGNGVTKADVEALANAVDFERLEKALQS